MGDARTKAEIKPLPAGLILKVFGGYVVVPKNSMTEIINAEPAQFGIWFSHPLGLEFEENHISVNWVRKKYQEYFKVSETELSELRTLADSSEKFRSLTGLSSKDLTYNLD